MPLDLRPNQRQSLALIGCAVRACFNGEPLDADAGLCAMDRKHIACDPKHDNDVLHVRARGRALFLS